MIQNRCFSDVGFWFEHKSFWIVVGDEHWQTLVCQMCACLISQACCSLCAMLSACCPWVWSDQCVFVQEAPMNLSKSNVRSLNSCANSRAGVKRSSNLSGYMGSGRVGSSHRAVGDAVVGSRQRERATRMRVITGAAKALPTAFLRRLCPALMWASVDSRKVQSAGKPRSRSASVGLMTLMFFPLAC